MEFHMTNSSHNSQDPISNLSSRVKSLEGRFDDNAGKINSRLDQIVELMQKVTQLQEREIKNAENIIEVKHDIKESNKVIREWNQKIHERLDGNTVLARGDRDGLAQVVSNAAADLHLRIDAVEGKTQSNKEEFHKWFNRVSGGWVIASVLLLFIQGMGAYVLNGLHDKDIMLESALYAANNRMTAINSRLTFHAQQISELQHIKK